MAASDPVIFFTPGAWHTSWCFDAVRAELARQGFKTGSVDLPSVVSTDASVGIFEDTAVVRAEIEKLVDAGKDVVLVAHSFSGLACSNAVEGLSYKQRAAKGKIGGITMLIYLTAFAIPVGLSALAALRGVYPEWWNINGEFFSPDRPQEIFYGDIQDPALVSEAIKRLEVQSFKTVSQISGYAPWNEDFELGYIFTELDQALSINAQKGMFSQFPSNTYTATLNSSHSPFLSMPGALADVLVSAAAEASQRKSS